MWRTIKMLIFIVVITNAYQLPASGELGESLIPTEAPNTLSSNRSGLTDTGSPCLETCKRITNACASSVRTTILPKVIIPGLKAGIIAFPSTLVAQKLGSPEMDYAEAGMYAGVCAAATVGVQAGHKFLGWLCDKCQR